MEENLERHVLDLWYPRAVDTRYGGFTENFDERWKPVGSQTQRSIVYQSRLTWLAAQVSRRFPRHKAEYRKYVQHGVRALSEHMWDKQKGGFFWQVDAATGKPMAASGEKHAYGISFGIYACANAYRATRDQKALSLAKKAFLWLDDRAHDDRNGGYFEALARNGKPIMSPPAPGGKDFIGTTYGFKSMNSHIHLLEAFTELHRAWPDPKVKRRLDEVFSLVRDRIYVDPGCLHQFFNPDWKPIPELDSFGHDVETAYLLLEAMEELGIKKDKETSLAARRLVDHALEFGWDDKNGGFYDKGVTFGQATYLDKVWWIQAEGLNALSLMRELYPAQESKYGIAFKKQWMFIQNHQVDSRSLGWISTVQPNGDALPDQPKSTMWKDPYHQARALMNVIVRQRRRAAKNAETPAANS
jgi:mannobiose 2-epimerase